MTEQKDKLRKGIKEIEFKVPVPMDNGEIEARYVHLEDRGIAKIIALFEPLIEEAKTQLLQKLKDDNFKEGIGWSMGVCGDIEQALRGEK